MPLTVAFVGNHALPTTELRAAMTSPVDDQEGFERDLLLVSAYYWDRGYANVRVSDTPDPAHDTVTITIDEGDKFTMGPVAVVGELDGDARDLPKLATRPGSVFSRTHIADDREALNDFYTHRGYAFADVVPRTTIDPRKHTIALTFEITPNKLAHVDHLTLYNDTLTSDDAILGDILLVPGALYDGPELDAARTRIQVLAHTDRVWISTRKVSDELIAITVEVQKPED